MFNQPRWIANADISFDHPDWGTRATLSVYAQSEVLDSAAGYVAASGGLAIPDRYQKPYYQLDATLSQWLNDTIKVSFSIKNLTDTPRGLYYDGKVIDGAPTNEEYRIGREYSVSVSATF